MMGRMDVGEAFYCAPSGLADVVNLETDGGEMVGHDGKDGCG